VRWEIAPILSGSAVTKLSHPLSMVYDGQSVSACRQEARMKKWSARILTCSVFLALSASGIGALAQRASSEPQLLPTGQSLTPTAAPNAKFQLLKTHFGPNPDYVADGAAALVASPNGREMLLLTSGYNRFNGPDGKRDVAQSQQYVFVYTIGSGGAQLKQTLAVPNAFSGIAWRNDGAGFFVAGGVDDVVHAFKRGAKGYAPDGSAIALGHAAGVGAGVQPQAAGLAVSPNGKLLLVANYYNDSVSLIDIKTRKIIAEQDLRPGKIDNANAGIPGGENPFAIVWRDSGRAYVSAARDREIVALDVRGSTITVASRIETIGEPTALLIDGKSKRLFAAEDNADRIAIINTQTDEIASEPRLRLPEAPEGQVAGKGLNVNNLSLTPKGKLLVTLGGVNALAIVDPGDGEMEGLIPTGWYPSAVASSRDGRQVFVANRKSPPGPNPDGCGPRMAVERSQPNACGSSNQYIFQLEKAGLLSFRTPTASELNALTVQVADNTGVSNAAKRAEADKVMAELRQRIKHVVFIVKENRTYDQVLGDLEVGNGDPSLAILGERLTPNHHDLARNFVTFDNFFDSGEQSSTGWTWSTAARSTDLLEKTAPVDYSDRGLSYEAEGTSRNINMSLPVSERHAINPAVPDDPDLLPGTRHLTAPDSDDDEHEDDQLEGQGFLWNAAIRAGLTVRNYGFTNDFIYHEGPGGVPLSREPFKDKQVVYVAADRALQSRSDPYFRGYDQKFPDYWRVKEWMREFADQEATNSVPSLSLVRISHDHFGAFGAAIDGVNSVETEMADNDYALGMIVDRIAHSRVKDSTLVFVIEDDAQNGADHVDARRSLAYIVGPYVKHKAVVSERYTTVSMLRTIGAILGLKPLGLNDALAVPMSEAFDLQQSDWTYTPRPSEVLRQTQLPITWPAEQQRADTTGACPLRTAAYWETAMAGQNFDLEDRLDTDAFNAALWAGLAGPHAAAPTRTGLDLSGNRDRLLKMTRPPCHAG
jgi:DNA-binding beta-propeller fold protein YncE